MFNIRTTAIQIIRTHSTGLKKIINGRLDSNQFQTWKNKEIISLYGKISARRFFQFK